METVNQTRSTAFHEGNVGPVPKLRALGDRRAGVQQACRQILEAMDALSIVMPGYDYEVNGLDDEEQGGLL